MAQKENPVEQAVEEGPSQQAEGKVDAAVAYHYALKEVRALETERAEMVEVARQANAAHNEGAAQWLQGRLNELNRERLGPAARKEQALLRERIEEGASEEGRKTLEALDSDSETEQMRRIKQSKHPEYETARYNVRQIEKQLEGLVRLRDQADRGPHRDPEAGKFVQEQINKFVAEVQRPAIEREQAILRELSGVDALAEQPEGVSEAMEPATVVQEQSERTPQTAEQRRIPEAQQAPRKGFWRRLFGRS